MTVRFSRQWVWSWTGFAVLWTAFLIYRTHFAGHFDSTVFYVQLITTGIFWIVCLGYWRKPYFTITPKTLVISGSYFPIKRIFPFRKLRMENETRLIAESKGDWKYLPIQKWMCNGDDWNALSERLSRP